MNEFLTESVFWGVALTFVTYQAGLWVKKKVKIDLANPLLVASLMTIAILLALGIDYETYNYGAEYVSTLLTPATVSLAIPLYRQLELLKNYPKAILISIAAGVLTAMGSILIMSILFGLSHEQYVTLLPKSITAGIATGVSEKMGGMVTLTLVSITITGIGGNIIAEPVLKLFRIKEPIAKGLAVGTASHALGTAKAMEMGEAEGAMSSLSIVVAGVLTVAAAFVFARLL